MSLVSLSSTTTFKVKTAIPAVIDNAAPSAVAATGIREFLAFTLGAEHYGVDIQMVQELRGYDAVTRLANTPDYFKGVVNLRGIIVPIIDLRMKFSLSEPRYDQFTVVIIVNISGRVVGMVVDSVSDVITLDSHQIKPTPAMALDADYLIGIGTIDERMLILIDIEKLMAADDIGICAKLAA